MDILATLHVASWWLNWINFTEACMNNSCSSTFNLPSMQVSHHWNDVYIVLPITSIILFGAVVCVFWFGIIMIKYFDLYMSAAYVESFCNAHPQLWMISRKNGSFPVQSGQKWWLSEGLETFKTPLKHSFHPLAPNLDAGTAIGKKRLLPLPLCPFQSFHRAPAHLLPTVSQVPKIIFSASLLKFNISCETQYKLSQTPGQKMVVYLRL